MAKIKSLFMDILGETHFSNPDKSILLKSACGVLKPRTIEQIKAILAVANQYQVKLYPISRGRNIGYDPIDAGDEEYYILDLSSMNQILDYDEHLGFVTIEPGVTYQQLFIFLRQQNSSLMNSVGGGPSDASFIGNVLERGWGSGLYGDHSRHFSDLEVILPNGNMINTGYSSFEHSKCKSIRPYGIGPDSTGLFIQSNLGIVTKMTLWLEPIPEHFATMTFAITNESDLSLFIEGIHQLCFKQIRECMTPGLMIHDKLSMAQSALEKFSDSPQPKGDKKTDALTHITGDWYSTLCFYCNSKKQLNNNKSIANKILKNCSTMIQYTERSRKDIYELFDMEMAKILKPETVQNHLNYLPMEALSLGAPTNENLKLCYYEKMVCDKSVLDPMNHGCGVLSVSIPMPFSNKDVISLIHLVKNVLAKYNFPNCIGIPGFSERTLNLVCFIIYDSENATQSQRAEICYKELIINSSAAGYIPSRMAKKFQQFLPKRTNNNDEFFATLKKLCDPNDILVSNNYYSDKN